MAPFVNFLRQIYNRDRLLLPILIIGFFASGCNSGIDTPYLIVENFPVEKQIIGEPLPQLNDCIGIIDIQTAGSYLLCKEHKTAYHFAVYDSDFRLVKHWGRNGRGPGEYLAPIYYGQCERTDSGIRFYLWERSAQELETIDIVTQNDSTSLHVVSTFKMPQNPRVEPRILIWNGANSFFGVTDIEDCRFFTCDSTFRNPAFMEPVLPFEKIMAHDFSQSCYGIKPDNSRIAIAYFCLPQIDIRASDGNIVRTVFLNTITDPRDLDLNELPSCFLKADADDQYIYALYEDTDSELSGRNSILVFDWDGNPVAKYSILRASSFTIDKQSNRIVTINVDQTNTLCSIYPLS